MRFLIDGPRERVKAKMRAWPAGVVGQLVTPLTRYHVVPGIPFAVDNGAFSRLSVDRFRNLLVRLRPHQENCLFVCVPDRVGPHTITKTMWAVYGHLARGWRRAFVAQDGFDGMPSTAEALFIGGTDSFKNSGEARDIVRHHKDAGIHVHVGRVNSAERFTVFSDAGADTCDGSGVSMYDHMLERLQYEVENPKKGWVTT